MAEKEGFLDPIEETAPATPAEPPEPSPEPAEPAPAVDAQPGADKPVRPADNRPEGFVAKGERDRIAGELHQERQARAQAEARFHQMVERFYKENEPAKAQEAVPEAPGERPDPVNDPYGYTIWRAKKDDFDDYQRGQAEQQTQQRTQQEQGWQRALGEVNTYFNQAKAAKPELEGLYQGVRESFAKEYAAYAEASGRTVNPVEVARQVERQEAQIIAWAYQNRVPIDAVIERMAAARGVTAKAPEPGQQQPEQKRDPNTGQFVSEAEKAAKIATSQERNASLGAAPGAPVKKMTKEELARMPEEEMWKHFESFKGRKGSKQFERDMGFRS